jgi:hypothetical protein
MNKLEVPMNARPNPVTPTLPWWRVGSVWLVIAGPAVVVVASFFTLHLALSRPEVIIDVPVAQGEQGASLNAAMKARNHAATPRP